MKNQLTFRHLIFALLLLISQQLGLAHVYSHHNPVAGGMVSPEAPLPADLPCDECLLLASFGAALGYESGPSLDKALGHESPSTWLSEHFSPARLAAFQSRDPPSGS